MKKRVPKSQVAMTVCLTCILGSVAILGVRSQLPAAALPASPAFAERHPEMRAALRNLEKVQDNLQKAARDYDGHRAKALDLVNQAIVEVKLGIDSDRK